MALTLFLALTQGSSAQQAGGFNVDSLVTFTPLSSTYRTVSNTTGCPAGCVGKFTFTARLTNKSTSPAMPGITVRVLTLSNSNLLLDPQTNAVLGGAGAVMQVPKVGEYADGQLSPGETVDVPFVLCLKTLQPFQFLVDVAGIVTELVGAGIPYLNSISANGRFAAFSSGRSLYVRDLVTKTTKLAAETDLFQVVFSADSRFMGFTVGQLSQHPRAEFYPADVFLRNMATGATTLVSVNRAGTGHSGSHDTSWVSSISANGRFVVFSSNTSDLVATDTTGTGDVFVRDMQTGTTTLVSVNMAGTGSGNRASAYGAAISADGRFVAFNSEASDLVSTDTNGTSDVFVRDLQTQTTTLVSVNRFGTDSGNHGGGLAGFSMDGRFVLINSRASDLVTETTVGTGDVFVRDLQTGTTTLVSVNMAGTGSGAFSPVLSANGRFVAFVSYASDLVANDTNGTYDLFVRDLQTGTTSLVSVNQAGTGSGNDSSPYTDPTISADGRFVAFDSRASDLVAVGTGGLDVFVRDLQTGTTRLVSVNRFGTNGGNGGSVSPEISADGRFVVFNSGASDLVVNDTNTTADVFVRPVQ